MPDWIFPESVSGVYAGLLLPLPETLLEYYEPVTLTIHNSDRNASRPCPEEHVPFTTEKFKEIVIYKKIRD